MENRREHVGFYVRLELTEGTIFMQFFWQFVPFYISSERK